MGICKKIFFKMFLVLSINSEHTLYLSYLGFNIPYTDINEKPHKSHKILWYSKMCVVYVRAYAHVCESVCVGVCMRGLNVQLDKRAYDVLL